MSNNEFDKMCQKAKDIWNHQLGRIEVNGGKLEVELGSKPNKQWRV